MKRRGILSLVFLINLAIVVTILGYRAYLSVTAPEASALLVPQIERIEAETRASDTVSFAVVGEANNSIGVFERRIIPLINASSVDFMVSVGNILNGGGEDKHRALLGTLSHLQKPYLLTFGENESEEFGSSRFYQRFGPHFYSVALGGVRLVFLDSTGRTPTDWQERWLRDILSGENTRRVIVFAGHPVIEPVEDTFFEPTLGAWSSPAARSRFLSLLQELGVDMVISSGAATYSDQTVDGIRHILTGGAGGFVMNDETSFYHYLNVAITPTGIAVDMVRTDTSPTLAVRQIEGLWFFIYSLFYVGIWNFLLIFSGFVLLGIYLFNRLFRERQYYPSYDSSGTGDLGRPLRIAMFTNTYLPFIGGVSLSISRLKAGLERQGHEVLVICPRYPGGKEDRTVLRVPVLVRSGEMIRIANPVHIQTRRAVLDFHPDVIHLHHPFWLGSMGLRLARTIGVPAIFTYHTRLELYSHRVPLPGALFRNVVAHWVIRRFANQCDQVVVPTPVTRDYIRLIGVHAPVHVYPTGVEIEQYEINDPCQIAELNAQLNPDGRLLLITISRLSKEKSLDFMMSAMVELKRRNAPPFRLLVLGDGDERTHLNKFICDNDLTNDVHLVGNVCSDEVPTYLQIADIFVFASSSETQGMVILEAMAAGLPVVAVQSSGIDAFVVNKRTGLVTIDNLGVWTDAVHALLVSTSERHAMGLAARDAAQQHSVENFASGIVTVYQTALAVRPKSN